MPNKSYPPYQNITGDDLIRVIAADLKHAINQNTAALADVQHTLNRMEFRIMADLDQDLELIQQQGTQIDGVATLIATLRQQIADAMSGVTLPPAVQAKVDAVFAGLTANSGKLAVALTTQPDGTPATPPTV